MIWVDWSDIGGCTISNEFGHMGFFFSFLDVCFFFGMEGEKEGLVVVVMSSYSLVLDSLLYIPPIDLITPCCMYSLRS